MSLYATKGLKLFIGAAIDQKSEDFVAADFTSQTWTEIKNLENLGSLGDTSESVSVSLIGEARAKILKGTRSAGTMEVVCGIDNADAGQIAAIAAEKSDFDFAFKLELNDKPATGASPKNGQRLFIAKVMSSAEVFDSANNVMKRNLSLAVNSNVVRVAASAT
ncbi:hypothetical protein [Rhizobium sp. Root483D2]|uniref:hypothetical protein n=1 Tax=Rhizobium sp. Root483D2 TaxID=1736545 RepID=UPI0007160CA2|nr:hypothetical protein [Rhizobium sp. Root483D2]KQY21019.1 hypothetical protein ASD32_06470 [Rhizobium sp. Root483D2]